MKSVFIEIPTDLFFEITLSVIKLSVQFCKHLATSYLISFSVYLLQTCSSTGSHICLHILFTSDFFFPHCYTRACKILIKKLKCKYLREYGHTCKIDDDGLFQKYPMHGKARSLRSFKIIRIIFFRYLFFFFFNTRFLDISHLHLFLLFHSFNFLIKFTKK